MISISVQGLTEAQDLLKTIQRMGSKVIAVELLGHKRKENPNLSNNDILKFMADDGRDFYRLTDADVSKIGRILRDKMEEGLKSSLMAKKKPEAAANYIAGVAFREAGKWLAKKISKRIKDGDWVGHRGDLSEEYADYKQKEYGFTHPIGVATGQLRDNLNPTSANLKIKRG